MVDDTDALRTLCDDALTALRSNAQALAGHLDDREAHLRAYAVFEDALTAAGCASAHARDDEVDELLHRAADAATQVFRLRGAVSTEIGDLDTGGSERFVDTSTTNPFTFVQAVYAAVAAGNERAVDALARLAPPDFTSDQVTVPVALERHSVALLRVLQGRPDDARRHLRALRAGPDDDPDTRSWRAQAIALDRIAAGDPQGFRTAMADVRTTFEEAHADEDMRNDPERYLALPVLGLEALARRELRAS